MLASSVAAKWIRGPNSVMYDICRRMNVSMAKIKEESEDSFGSAMRYCFEVKGLASGPVA